MLRVAFAMEQHLGHQTYYQNLRRWVHVDPSVQARWIPIAYASRNALWEKLPMFPPGLRGTLRGRDEIRAALHTTAADEVVFCNTQVPAVLGNLAEGRRPYVLATDITPIQYDRLGVQYGHRADKAGLLAAYKHHRNVKTFRSAHWMLPWSTWAARSLIDDYGVAPERVQVVPPGVDLARWRPGTSEGGGPLRVLFVGGDFQRKGGDALLQVLRSLPPELLELHVVTKTALAAQPGLFVYNHFQPNDPALLALFQRSQVFVLPSVGEAFGIAAVEASACGLPVIATRVGGLTDIVRDGETGFLIDAGDHVALADRLRMLAEQDGLRCRMGLAARDHAEQQFNAQTNAQAIVACLREAALQSQGERHVA